MNAASARRCHDCLSDFKPDEQRFAVVVGKDYNYMTDRWRPRVAHVCRDCVGWYGTSAKSVPADEASA